MFYGIVFISQLRQTLSRSGWFFPSCIKIAVLIISDNNSQSMNGGNVTFQNKTLRSALNFLCFYD